MSSKTPILDLVEPLPKNSTDLGFREAIYLVLLTLGGGLVVFLVIKFPILVAAFFSEPAQWLSKTLSKASTFGILIALALGIALHELGHLAAAASQSMLVRGMTLGPMTFTRQNGRWSIAWHRWGPADGYAHAEFDRFSRVRRRHLRFIWGGPLANILIALIAGATAEVASGFTHSFLTTLAVTSGLLAIVSLLPFRLSGVATDGMLLFCLLRSRKWLRAWLSAVSLGLRRTAGTRFRDLPQSRLDAVSGFRDGTAEALNGVWMNYFAEHDRNNPERAALFLERCLRNIGIAKPQLREMTILESCYFHAWFTRDSRKALEWKARSTRPSLLPELIHLRLDIALLCLEDRFPEARVMWEKARDLVEAIPNDRARAMALIGWQEWRDEIEQRDVLSKVAAAKF